MSVPQIPLARLHGMTGDELREFPSVELTDEKGYIGTLIIPTKLGGMTILDNIINRATAAAINSNSLIPPSVIEAATNEPLPVDPYPHLTKARAAKKKERQLVNA